MRVQSLSALIPRMTMAYTHIHAGSMWDIWYQCMSLFDTKFYFCLFPCTERHTIPNSRLCLWYKIERHAIVNVKLFKRNDAFSYPVPALVLKEQFFTSSYVAQGKKAARSTTPLIITTSVTTIEHGTTYHTDKHTHKLHWHWHWLTVRPEPWTSQR
jgi:hypothetical protein